MFYNRKKVNKNKKQRRIENRKNNFSQREIKQEIKPIGVFDSGFGGLEILREIVRKLPQYDYVYLGDTARSPYGSRAQQTIYNYTVEAVNFLFSQNCPLLILACNTASSEALRKIQREYLPRHYPVRKVLGVIIPTAEEATEKTIAKRIGVIGTESTVCSRVFEREIKKLNPQIKVFQKSCPLLVPIVEAGEKNLEIIESVLKNYLNPLIEKNIDTLILGCTHYGLLKTQIEKITGDNIKIVAEGEIVAKKLVDYLKRHKEIESNLSRNSTIRFLTTDLSNRFRNLGKEFFGEEIRSEKINLG